MIDNIFSDFVMNFSFLIAKYFGREVDDGYILLGDLYIDEEKIRQRKIKELISPPAIKHRKSTESLWK